MSYKPTAVKAWTGGSEPAPFQSVSAGERSLVRHLYRIAVRECHLFWGDYPELDIRRIHWRRARYDAHATFRGEK